VSYDIFGKGHTALKAYYGRFYNQFGSEIAEAINPNARINVQIPWVDRDNDLILDTGELNLANFTGFTGVFPRMDANATRPYSDEMNVGIDHELAKNFGVSVSFHRRQHRNGLAIVDLARPASAYTPVSRTYLDQDRVTQSITVYSLDPALITRRDRVVTNVDVLESDYNGVQFSFNKRMSNRWQLLGGLSLQKHEGFNHSGTFTDPGSSTDLNNPNFRLNRDGSAIFTDIPWSFNLSGSYLFPGDVTFSGKFAARDGDPLLRTITIALPQASELIYFQPRGVDRTETVTQFVDIRVAKRFALGFTRLEGSIDVFNLLNANHVLAQNEAIGTTLGRPARILTPRIVRLGATLRF
jgi:hypothetical protein